MFEEKTFLLDEIFTVDLTLWSKCQIKGEDFVSLCGLLRKHELYNDESFIVRLKKKLAFFVFKRIENFFQLISFIVKSFFTFLQKYL